MKRNAAIRLLCAVFALTLLLGCLAACGKDKITGAYTGEYYKFVGDPDDAKVTDEPFSILLEDGGKGLFKRDGEEYRITWKLEGQDFSMTETFMGIKNEYTGTLADGRLDIFNGDPENIWTCEYVLNKATGNAS